MTERERIAMLREGLGVTLKIAPESPLIRQQILLDQPIVIVHPAEQLSEGCRRFTKGNHSMTDQAISIPGQGDL